MDDQIVVDERDELKHQDYHSNNLFGMDKLK